MRVFAPLLVSIIVLAFSASAHADNMRIIVFGDSLTSGYQLQQEEAFPTKLDRKLREIGYQNIEMLNMSLAGETTTGGLERLNAVISKRPDIVVLELGGNDAMRGINSALIHRNLATIISKLQAEKIYVVLMGVQAPPSMGLAYAQQIDAVYRALAEFYAIPIYLNALEGISERPEYTLADGLHPNAKGVDIMVEGMYRLVDTGLRWKWDMLQYQEHFNQTTPQPSLPVFPPKP